MAKVKTGSGSGQSGRQIAVISAATIVRMPTGQPAQGEAKLTNNKYLQGTSHIS